MLKKLFVFVIVLLIIAGSGGWLFRERIRQYLIQELIVSHPLGKADLIVALGGETLRKKEAVRLFGDGYGKKLLFTGFDIEKADYLRYGLKETDYIYPVKASENTYDEAVFTREVMKKNKFRTLLLVTSFYHTRRAEFIFKKVMAADGIDIIVVPVYNKNYDLKKWWQHSYLRKVVAIEWLGILYYQWEYK